MVLTLSAIGVQRKEETNVVSNRSRRLGEDNGLWVEYIESTAHHFNCEEPWDKPKLRGILQKITVLYYLKVPVTWKIKRGWGTFID